MAFSRRDFFTSALSLGAATSICLAATPAGGSRERRIVRTALFDARFSAARDFARAMGARGIGLAPFHGDVTPVWYHQLDPVWRRKPIALAGLTTEATLFCLELLAWDHGMRVAYRGLHEPAPGGGMTHVLESSSERVQDLADPFSGMEPWGRAVGRLVARIDAPRPAFPSVPEARSRAMYRTRSAPDDARLVSWLIAPKDPRALAPAPI